MARRMRGLDEGRWVELLAEESRNDQRVKSLVGRVIGGRVIREAVEKLRSRMETEKNSERGKGKGRGGHVREEEEANDNSEKTGSEKVFDARFLTQQMNERDKWHGKDNWTDEHDVKDDVASKESDQTSANETFDSEVMDLGGNVDRRHDTASGQLKNRKKKPSNSLNEKQKEIIVQERAKILLHPGVSKNLLNDTRRKLEATPGRAQVRKSKQSKTARISPQARNQEQPLHPSWKAKRRQAASITFQGTRKYFESSSDSDLAQG